MERMGLILSDGKRKVVQDRIEMSVSRQSGISSILILPQHATRTSQTKNVRGEIGENRGKKPVELFPRGEKRVKGR